MAENPYYFSPQSGYGIYNQKPFKVLGNNQAVDYQTGVPFGRYDQGTLWGWMGEQLATNPTFQAGWNPYDPISWTSTAPSPPGPSGTPGPGGTQGGTSGLAPGQGGVDYSKVSSFFDPLNRFIGLGGGFQQGLGSLQSKVLGGFDPFNQFIGPGGGFQQGLGNLQNTWQRGINDLGSTIFGDMGFQGVNSQFNSVLDAIGGLRFPSSADISKGVVGGLDPTLQSILSGVQGIKPTDLSGVMSGLAGLGSQFGTGFTGLQGGQTDLLKAIQGLKFPGISDIASGVGTQLGSRFTGLEGLLGGLGTQMGGLGTQMGTRFTGLEGLINRGFGGLKIPSVADISSGIDPQFQNLLSQLRAQIEGIPQIPDTINIAQQLPPGSSLAELLGMNIEDFLKQGQSATSMVPSAIPQQTAPPDEVIPFQAPAMPQIPDYRQAVRDPYLNMVLGNTGAQTQIADALSSALNLPNPYAEQQGTALSGLLADINADYDKGQRDLLNTFAVTNKLDMPIFRQGLQEFEGQRGRALSGARGQFALERARSEEPIRRGRIEDLLGFNQGQIGNLQGALQGAIGERAGETGLQQNVFGNALQQYFQFLNAQNQAEDRSLGLSDEGLRLALGGLGTAINPGTAVGGAMSGLGNVANFGQQGGANFMNLLSSILSNPGIYGG